jgi:hypothetical protein
MSPARDGRRDGPPAAGAPPPAWGPPRADWRRAVLILVLILVALAGVVHPLRRYVVEPRRQALLGNVEPPGRRLALASQFGFSTAAGASVRLVPGTPAMELGDVPAQAVTLILGGFRGPYVVWLWMKAEDEKRMKVHFDLLDRYTKIAALQSDYPQMWVFHVWNIVWNVPVQWQSMERKYQWIRRGIEFLGEGYRKNPRSAEIMAEMGRIYSEKIGRSQEAYYYRQRVKEEEGRSAFLIAYEWYDRARKANDRYDSLGRSLSKPVIYSQACHNLSYYAKELVQEAYDALKESVEARAAGREADARKAAQDGFRKLADAESAWQWARREWQDQALRFEKEGSPGVLLTVYKRFFAEADHWAAQTAALRQSLTYENLPEKLPGIQRPEIQ